MLTEIHFFEPESMPFMDKLTEFFDTCVNCHMGEERNHSLIVAVHTCDECHTDLHQARRMLDAGLAIPVMAEPAAMAEVVKEPEVKEEEIIMPEEGGVKMPDWTLIFSGMLIGGVLAWALVGKDPGQPSDKVRKGKS